MNENELKWEGIGVVYAIIGTQQLTFEGQISKQNGSIFVKDQRTQRLIELAREAVKQIVWKTEPTPAGAAKGAV